VGYLPQDAPPPGETTLRDAMLRVFATLRAQGDALADLEHELAGAARMQGRSAEDAERYRELLATYGKAQTEFEVAGGYTYETRINQVLGGLGFNEDEHGSCWHT